MKISDNTIFLNESARLMRLSYSIVDKYQRNKDIVVMVFANETMTPEEVIKSLKDKLDLGKEENVAYETADLEVEDVLTPYFSANMRKIHQMRRIYKIAMQQYECNRDEVCGVWRISGETFCKENGLDDVSAFREQKKDDAATQGLMYVEEKAKLESKLGEISEEQDEKLHTHIMEQYPGEREGAAYWKDVVAQIEEIREKLSKEEGIDDYQD